MPGKKGFTLIELVVVMVIIGIIVAFIVPNYSAMMQQGAAKAAQDNLITIYNAQKSYYFSNNGSYCTVSCASLNVGANSIDNILGLNITDNNFTYACTPHPSNFQCTATNIGDPNLKLTLTYNPIVLPGGLTCASSTGANPGCNPSCVSDHSAYCPS